MKDLLKLYNTNPEDDNINVDKDELSLEDIEKVVGGRRIGQN